MSRDTGFPARDASDDFSRARRSRALRRMSRGLRDGDVDVVRGLLERHRELTGSPVAGRLLDDWSAARARFSLILPRDYQRVLDVRAAAEAEGLDLDGTEVWDRIMEASRG